MSESVVRDARPVVRDAGPVVRDARPVVRDAGPGPGKVLVGRKALTGRALRRAFRG